jgi:hypothetical protein
MVFVKSFREIGFNKKLNLAELRTGGLTHVVWVVVVIFSHVVVVFVFVHGGVGVIREINFVLGGVANNSRVGFGRVVGTAIEASVVILIGMSKG